VYSYIYAYNKTYRHEVSVLNKDAMLFYFNGKLRIENYSDHIKVFIYHLSPLESWYLVCLSHVRQARVHHLMCR